MVFVYWIFMNPQMENMENGVFIALMFVLMVHQTILSGKIYN